MTTRVMNPLRIFKIVFPPIGPGWRILLVIALLLPTGCQRLALFRQPVCDTTNKEFVKYSQYASPLLAQRPPHRVLVVPSGSGHQSFEARDQLIDNLAAEIRLNGLFEVVSLPRGTCDTSVDAVLRGTFDERELLRLARQYNVDSILLVQLNQLQTQWPTHLQASVVLIDVYDSVVTFAVDGNWNTAERNIGRSYETFVRRRHSDLPEYLLKPQLHAPSNLSSYAAWQTAGALRIALGR